MKVVGIEGTAWNASAAVFDPDGEGDGVVSLVNDAYVPESGGIHPREASEHISGALPDVIEQALEGYRDDVGVVAFSRGPGLGPCLRNTATASRALALKLDVPLVGVNHTLAHVEMGRYLSGFSDPLVLDAAGANTLVTAYRGGRYRVLGETMDTGVGNALDKFARHAGLGHPGGPKLEELARGVGEEGYVELPYTVKGMDFSFSGIVNAAQQKFDDGIGVERLSYSLQENVFAMLSEVSERALGLTRKQEFVVGGGVMRNERLQEMLREMCGERGVSFYSPERRYLGDNAAMIAVTGWMMHEAGETVEVEDSGVRPDWRPDDVEVPWRNDVTPTYGGSPVEIKGAEAVLEFDGEVRKRRVSKTYRCRPLDERLRRQRTAGEARLLGEARGVGVPTPVVLDVDTEEHTLTMELLLEDGGVAPDLTETVDDGDARRIGELLSRLHAAGVAHGDPTTRNFVRSDSRIYLLDFGLAYNTRDVEDYGMDVHVFRQTLEGTVDDADALLEEFWIGYSWEEAAEVRDRFREIEGRGRYL